MLLEITSSLGLVKLIYSEGCAEIFNPVSLTALAIEDKDSKISEALGKSWSLRLTSGWSRTGVKVDDSR